MDHLQLEQNIDSPWSWASVFCISSTQFSLLGLCRVLNLCSLVSRAGNESSRSFHNIQRRPLLVDTTFHNNHETLLQKGGFLSNEALFKLLFKGVLKDSYSQNIVKTFRLSRNFLAPLLFSICYCTVNS